MTELDAQLARRKLTTITRNLDLLATVEGLALVLARIRERSREHGAVRSSRAR
ncbi:MAG: hypothetical protein WD773_00510 [Gemmatimonadales bacterium]